MKFLFIMCSLFIIGVVVIRFGRELEAKRPNYLRMVKCAAELIAVAVIFANF